MAFYFFFFFHEKKENKGVSKRSRKAKREESVVERRPRNSCNSQLLWGRSGFGSLSSHGFFGYLGVRTDRKVQCEFCMGCSSAGFGEQHGDFGIFLK